MNTVVIIVVHYNAEKDTLECLDSLRDISHVGFSFKVLVVDNASKQPLQLPKRFPDEFEVIRSEANLGFTGGNNLGIWYAKEHIQPEYICLLNNDTTVEPTFLEKLYTYLQDHVEVGMVSPKIYFSKNREFHNSYSSQEKGQVLWFAGGVVDWANLDAFHVGVDEIDRGQFDQISDTDFNTGCCVLMPSSVLERVGTLDKKYFLYLEDVDLSLRVAKAGYQLKYVPSSVIWHKNAGSTGGSGSEVHQYYQSRNRLLFSLKHGSIRVRLRALKQAVQFLIVGSKFQQRAVVDLVLQRFGKQPIL